MQHIKHAVISCAGLGSRLGLDMPKCMVELNGRTLVSYLLELCSDIEDVRVIVGFKERLVMNHVRSIRPDVTFVRNPDYASTSNSYSVYLATRDLKNPYVMIDGDMIIKPADFNNFLGVCAQSEKDIVGVAKSKTEEAVFVTLNERCEVTAFHRSPRAEHEWCGIAFFKSIQVVSEEGYVYKHFIDRLPLETFEFECYEIDTPEDLNLVSSHAHNLFGGGE